MFHETWLTSACCREPVGLALYVKETSVHFLERWGLKECEAPDKD